MMVSSAMAGLARLAVPDDQFALAPSDGRHRIDALDPGVERLGNRLSGDDPGRLDLDEFSLLRLDGTLAVDGVPERIHHPSE